MSRCLIPWLTVSLLAVSCASVHPVPLPQLAQSHRVKTPDGWELELVRYPAEGGTRQGAPVLMVHGISSNARGVDVDATHSMPRWFAAHGREAWTLSLRGTGTSSRPGENGLPQLITFDDYWKSDLPTAIAEIRSVTGSDTVQYIGHSMGGMTLYAYLSQGGQHIERAVTLGSPTRLDWGQTATALLARFTETSISKFWSAPSEWGAHVVAPLQPAMPDGPMERMLWNPESSRLETFQTLLAWGTSDTAGGTGKQLVRLVSGEFKSADGSIDFRADMKRINTPILVVAGKLDRVAPVPSVKDAYRLIGGQKRWLLITRANGAAGEYGHMDLLIGDRAATEVWSPVLDFLSQVP